MPETSPADREKIKAALDCLDIESCVDGGHVLICERVRVADEHEQQHKVVDAARSDLFERLESAGLKLVDADSDHDSIWGKVELNCDAQSRPMPQPDLRAIRPAPPERSSGYLMSSPILTPVEPTDMIVKMIEALEIPCEECGASGLRPGEVNCIDCNGTGLTLTDAGEKVLAFICRIVARGGGSGWRSGY